jgi:hypothetical protein
LPKSKLRPDEKVDAAIYLSDVCVHICVDSIKDEDRTISGRDLMKRVRERISFSRNRQSEV